MNFLTPNPVRMTLIAALSILGATSFARADIKDYEFQLVQTEAKAGEAIVAVRLVHLPDGKPVPDAVIFATRADMAPEGMETMTTSIEPMPSTEPGIYPFKVNLTMPGGWQLSLGAKVQGESETLESKLQLRANP
jgi:YtkA-like